jgi:hypothetical protein
MRNAYIFLNDVQTLMKRRLYRLAFYNRKVDNKTLRIAVQYIICPQRRITLTRLHMGDGTCSIYQRHALLLTGTLTAVLATVPGL